MIGITVEINNSVNIYVDGRPVILTEAIGGQASRYEQRILERKQLLKLRENHNPGKKCGLDVGPQLAVHTWFGWPADRRCILSRFYHKFSQGDGF